MNRLLLRRKPVESKYTPSNSDVSVGGSLTQSSDGTKAEEPMYFENVAKDSFDSLPQRSSASLEAAFSNQSISDPYYRPGPQSEVRFDPQSARQETEHVRSPSDGIGFRPETAVSNSSQGQGTFFESTNTSQVAYTPESSVNSESPRFRRNKAHPNDGQINRPLRDMRADPESPSRDRIGYAVSRDSGQNNDDDDDDLLSDCSDDSFVEAERLKYYMGKVTDAIHATNWLEAKENIVKFIDILSQQPNGKEIEPNMHFLNSTIHYMVGELDTAMDILNKMPKKRSTEPVVLVTIFNLQAAILFRQGAFDEALGTAKKGAKYARKSDLKNELNEALYISSLCYEAKRDSAESRFYKQMVPSEYKPPRFIQMLDRKEEPDIDNKPLEYFYDKPE